MIERLSASQALPPKCSVRLATYFSISRSFSPRITGATIILIRPGSGTFSSPLICSTSWVDFLLSVIVQVPEIRALPSPLTGVQTTVPFFLSDT